MKLNNTYDSGRMTLLVLEEQKGYTGVCLEFNLVIKAPTIEEAKEHIEDLANAWLKNVQKNHLSEKLLNNPAPRKYWKISEVIEKQIASRKVAHKKELRKPGDLDSRSFFFSIVQNYLCNKPLVLN